MSSAESLTARQWSRKTSSTPPADSTPTQPKNSIESLQIEDLELEDSDVSPPSSEATCEAAEPSKIFGEKVPAVVSERCHMNDLYILVKVPTNPQKYIPMSNKASQTRGEESNSRGIFSIQEEEGEEHSVAEPDIKTPTRNQGNNKNHCWVKDQDDLEEFASRTQIRSPVSFLPNQVHEQIEELPQEVPPELPQPCHDQIDMKEVNLKDGGEFCLENYGVLVTPTRTPRTENLLVFQVDTERKSKTLKSRSASCFEWLTKWFRRKRRRTDLIHAKVYKTYFVKWKKCPELSECPRCQGRQSLRRNST